MINKISHMHDDEIRKRTGIALAGHTDDERIKGLMGRYGGIKQMGLSMASVILAFYDPKNYGIYNIHAWSELLGSRPKNMFSSYENLIMFLANMRQIAKEYDVDTRIVEKAYFKKHYDSTRLN